MSATSAPPLLPTIRTGQSLLLPSVLALVTFLLYFKTHAYSFIDYDDLTYLVRDRHIRGGLSWANLRWVMTDVHSGNWYPLTLLVELTMSTLFGIRASAFHILNAILHTINVLLLYLFLKRTTGMSARALFVAALWGWHPLRVESVGWIMEMRDVLCGTFWLLCMLAYANYRQSPSIRKYLAVAGFLVLALLTKSMAVTLPAVLLLLDWWPLDQKGSTQSSSRWWSARILEKVPLLLLFLGAAVAAYVTQRFSHATGSPRFFPLNTRLANALVSYAIYMGKTIWPIHLGMVYPHPALIGEYIPLISWLLAATLLVVITVWVFLQRNVRPYLFVGWLWFFGTLLPVIGLIQIGEQAMADRYSYLPTMGLIIAIVWWVSDAVASVRAVSKIAVAVGLAACTALVTTTFFQVSYWRNSQTLFSHSNSVIANDYVAQVMLSKLARDDGDFDDAIKLGRSATAICPLSGNTHGVLAEALLAANRPQDATVEFATALKTRPDNPALYDDYGKALIQLHQDDKAIELFQQAIKIDPYYVPARQDLAAILSLQGHYDQAISQWREAVRLEPGNSACHGWFAELLQQQGDRRGAMEQYRAAITAGGTNPDWESNLVWLVVTDPQTQPQEVQSLLAVAKDACNQTGNQQSLPLDAFAAALARAGRFDEAASIAATAADRADAEKRPTLAADIRARMHGYQSGQPYIVQLGSSQK